MQSFLIVYMEVRYSLYYILLVLHMYIHNMYINKHTHTHTIGFYMQKLQHIASTYMNNAYICMLVCRIDHGLLLMFF